MHLILLFHEACILAEHKLKEDSIAEYSKNIEINEISEIAIFIDCYIRIRLCKSSIRKKKKENLIREYDSYIADPAYNRFYSKYYSENTSKRFDQYFFADEQTISENHYFTRGLLSAFVRIFGGQDNWLLKKEELRIFNPLWAMAWYAFIGDISVVLCESMDRFLKLNPIFISNGNKLDEEIRGLVKSGQSSIVN